MEQDFDKHIMQIVMKNTSTLDFSMPLLWGIRQKYPKAQLTILYTTFNKSQILRNARYMHTFCAENNIQQYDFSDFFKLKLGPFRPLLKWIFRRSYSDTMSLRELKNIRLRNMCSIIGSISLRYFRPIERIISKLLVHAHTILPTLAPDFILFDNRTVTNFQGREDFYTYFETTQTPLALLPHAPHYIHTTDEFCRFDEQNDDVMPPYTEHWMPFKHGEPWLRAQDKKDQFIKIGYPGLDSSWWNYLSHSKKNDTQAPIHCLVMTRKFLPEGTVRPEGYDEFTLNYEEVIHFFTVLQQAAQHIDRAIHWIIKPHPSSSEPENRKVLAALGITDFTISYESFYELLPQVDCVISQFTTSLALPISYGIPTLLVETKLQSYVHEQWPVLADYYTGLNYYTTDANFKDTAVKMFTSHTQGIETTDSQHIRNYFDDGAIDVAVARIESQLEATS